MNQEIKTLGIIGGGQLGQMICHAANAMGFKTAVFNDIENSPASFATSQTIIADYLDESALEKFAQICDVITFEFENIPAKTIELLSEKCEIHPNANILKIAQNRILEKGFINSAGIATTPYEEISDFESLKNALAKFGKAILKTATMGYDGKGQFVLENIEDAKKAWNETKNTQLILEKFCPFDCEISVMVARSKSGEIEAYEPLTNIHKNGILDKSIYPAQIGGDLKKKSQDLAKKLAEKLDLIGILAIEFFVIGDDLFINEIAPRPHNSGHFSMDANVTSQFEQLVRAVNNLKLGSSKFHSKGYMQNLIGEDVNKIDEFYENDAAKIHLYAKSEVKAGRKMGHVNILAD